LVAIRLYGGSEVEIRREWQIPLRINAWVLGAEKEIVSGSPPDPSEYLFHSVSGAERDVTHIGYENKVTLLETSLTFDLDVSR
jgi:hypothetical protein